MGSDQDSSALVGVTNIKLPRMRPMSNITPFTYSDGTTYLEFLNKLSQYIKADLVPEVDSKLIEFVEKSNEAIEGIEKELGIDRDNLGNSFQQFTNTITEKVDLINNKSGSIDIVRETISTSYTVAINPTWPTNQPVYFMLTQDSSGGRSVVLDENVTGPLDVDTSANGVTEFWVIPQGDGTWKIFQPASGKENSVNDRAVSKLLSNETESQRTLVNRISEFVSPKIQEVTDYTASELSTIRETIDENVDSTTVALSEIHRLYTVDPIDAVFIGDSYFMGYQNAATPWIKDVPTHTVEMLNKQGMYDYRMHNYATGATGFIVGGANNFSGQLTRAINDQNIKDCRLVVIGGGRNDTGRSVFDATVDVIQRAKVAFPRAKIVVFPMWAIEKFNHSERVLFKSILDAAKQEGCVYHINSLWVNAAMGPEHWIDSVLHPKEQATKNFAAALYTLIQGGSLPPVSTGIATAASSGINISQITIDGWTVSLSLQNTVGADYTASYPVGTITHPVMGPANHQYLWGFSGNGTAQTLFQISSDNRSIFPAAGSTARAGLTGISGSYPVGM